MSERSSPTRPKDTTMSINASWSTAGSPRNGLVIRSLAFRDSIMRAASARETGAIAKDTSLWISARIPPIPKSTHGPNWGSRTRPRISSRFACTISATSSVTGPSSGTAFARSSLAAAATAAAAPSPRRTRSRSVLCAMASPQSFSTTGKPISDAAATAAVASLTFSSRANGMP